MGGDSPYAILCSYITAEHVMFIKQSLTYLAVNIIWMRKERGSKGTRRDGEGCAGGRARREWIELGKHVVRM